MPQSTGKNISVGRIFVFSVESGGDHVDAASPHNDTLLSVRRLQVNVQLLPLLKKAGGSGWHILQKATVNSNDLIHGMKLNGTLGNCSFQSWSGTGPRNCHR